MIVLKNSNVRKILGFTLPLLLIPAFVAAGTLLPDANKYPVIILCITLLSLVTFLTGFEQKKTGSRRLIIVAVMTALSVIGRFIPFFKPITALSVITAMYFGKEAGFLTGALAAVISDFYFGMGPWTPFQMLGFGLIGYFAGLLCSPLKKRLSFLLIYGAVSGVAFSFIMDIWTVVWYNGALDPGLYAAAILTALPHTAVYSLSNIIFLALFAKPFGRKLERVKRVYEI